jgi:hypothetical protein
LKFAWCARGAGRTELIAVNLGYAKKSPSHRHRPRSLPAFLDGESQGNDLRRPRRATNDGNQKQQRNLCLEGVEWTYSWVEQYGASIEISGTAIEILDPMPLCWGPIRYYTVHVRSRHLII